MFDSVRALIDEHREVQIELSDPAVHADPARAKRVNRRYAELSRIVAAHDAWVAASDDLVAARDLAREDDAFAEEVPALEERLADTQERLRRLLIPRDPDDARDVIMEIKQGEGGAESALFAADLLRMYLQYAASKGWKTELLERNESDLGGFKDVQVAIKGSSSDPAQGVWAHLKYEGGVHRVQRVPATESQGRIHTSTTGVLVFPEVDEPEEIHIDQNDLKIDVFRSSGPGGQSVNTTDSAVRITHLPTGIVVSMQNEKSQLQNREAGMRVLRARLLAKQQEERDAAASDARRSQIRGMDRSERIRTYNFPENRIADHRTGYKAYNLDQVMDGALEPIIASCIAADEEAIEIAAAKPLPEGSRWAQYGGTELEPLLAYTTLIDAKWLLELAESGGVLPAWQNVPAVAVVSLAGLRASTTKLQLPVAVLSYGWAARGVRARASRLATRTTRPRSAHSPCAVPCMPAAPGSQGRAAAEAHPGSAGDGASLHRGRPPGSSLAGQSQEVRRADRLYEPAAARLHVGLRRVARRSLALRNRSLRPRADCHQR